MSKKKQKSKEINTKIKSNNVGVKNGLGILPLGDRVLLEEVDSGAESTTASGIIIPEGTNANGETKRGKVVSVGEGQMVDGKLEKPNVKIGDTVLYSWGDVIKVNGKSYTIVSSTNITAIIK